MVRDCTGQGIRRPRADPTLDFFGLEGVRRREERLPVARHLCSPRSFEHYGGECGDHLPSTLSAPRRTLALSRAGSIERSLKARSASRATAGASGRSRRPGSRFSRRFAWKSLEVSAPCADLSGHQVRVDRASRWIASELGGVQRSEIGVDRCVIAGGELDNIRVRIVVVEAH